MYLVLLILCGTHPLRCRQLYNGKLYLCFPIKKTIRWCLHFNIHLFAVATTSPAKSHLQLEVISEFLDFLYFILHGTQEMSSEESINRVNTSNSQRVISAKNFIRSPVLGTHKALISYSHILEVITLTENHFLQVKIWFQNRRAKWKRVKAGLASGSHSSSGGKTNTNATKIVVPIPVHVNRFAVRTQHHQLEKQNGVQFNYQQITPGTSGQPHLNVSQSSAFLSAGKIGQLGSGVQNGNGSMMAGPLGSMGFSAMSRLSQLGQQAAASRSFQRHNS